MEWDRSKRVWCMQKRWTRRTATAMQSTSDCMCNRTKGIVLYLNFSWLLHLNSLYAGKCISSNSNKHHCAKSLYYAFYMLLSWSFSFAKRLPHSASTVYDFLFNLWAICWCCWYCYCIYFKLTLSKLHSSWTFQMFACYCRLYKLEHIHATERRRKEAKRKSTKAFPIVKRILCADRCTCAYQ